MNKKGQVSVELAIILPVALFMVFALAELCLMYNAKQVALLSVFRSARSYAVTQSTAEAFVCMHKTLKAVTFQDPVDKVSHLEIRENESKIFSSVVYLYKPLFPILPLANLFGHSLFSNKHSTAVVHAIKIKSGDKWAQKIKNYIPITAEVELNK